MVVVRELKKRVKDFKERIFTNTGFTIIEVMTVMALLALLTTLVLPDFQRAHDSYRLKVSTLELAKNIQVLQQRAITEGISCRMVFSDTNKDSYQMAQSFTAKRIKLPPGVIIEHNSFSDNKLEFNGTGAPNRGGHITIANNAKTLYVIISVATGRVKISQTPPP